MNQNDKAKFAEMMATACAIYDKPPMEKLALRAYWIMLERFDIENVTRACELHMQSSKFFPKPAELIELIEGGDRDKAGRAWQDVYGLVQAVGSWHQPKFDDSVAAMAVERVGGWKQLCQMKDNEAHFVQQRFMDAYTDCAQNRLVHDRVLLEQKSKEALPNLTNGSPVQIGAVAE